MATISRKVIEKQLKDRQSRYIKSKIEDKLDDSLYQTEVIAPAKKRKFGGEYYVLTDIVRDRERAESIAKCLREGTCRDTRRQRYYVRIITSKYPKYEEVRYAIYAKPCALTRSEKNALGTFRKTRADRITKPSKILAALGYPDPYRRK